MTNLWCIALTGASLLFLSSTAVVFVNADCELESVRLIHESDPKWEPNAILDVGANVGCWTIRGRSLFPNCKFMMFEAFQDFSGALTRVKDASKNKGMVDFSIEVLSSEDGKEVQFWAEGATGNSMFPQLLGRGGRGHSDIKPVTRTTKTLDMARNSSFLKDERIDILKLDVQGAELSVLQGATHILKEVSFVQFEASVIEYNKGGSCYYQVDQYLRDHGFYLYDMGDLQRNEGLFRSNGVGQFDSLYIRSSSEHLPESIRNLGPNLCGSGNDKNMKLPLPYNQTPSSNTTKGPASNSKAADTAEYIQLNQWFGHIGMLFSGILIGRFLFPKRYRTGEKRRIS